MIKFKCKITYQHRQACPIFLSPTLPQLQLLWEDFCFKQDLLNIQNLIFAYYYKHLKITLIKMSEVGIHSRNQRDFFTDLLTQMFNWKSMSTELTNKQFVCSALTGENSLWIHYVGFSFFIKLSIVSWKYYKKVQNIHTT